ncbi:deoxyribose-phosphate aldolase [Capnocytophaga canimorsus]|uniref:Deoxyribose-phosphate aldolase n=1 Tax=Capnocytophaga canimorsus (strain 5) TaxID=860228 RepID=F9YVR6_CAPCC|nr:deoxyribose-phosphate aldolase [Capnocytophaga canimorsus]AEK23230.1 Phosphodeoxyriboaldolase [Capnocytophaga canimorsus Cc5]WGU67805.1 deoxyribose-phosphate aldolase [Capnocytophaga canimorsus]CEN46922.1 Deoxyribose-phosphate aldolase [Capnocytophaga canimorsus]VEJ18340.1 Deoxyribose-phosphate aldolase 1 [Capnocytophaga canimorsus]
MELSKYIDHTLLKATATVSEIEALCKEAITHDFFSVCVNSGYVSYAKDFLKETDIKVCSVVGFPLGAMSTRSKVYETEQALADGADEIDMVINVGWLLSGKIDEVKQEISLIKKACGDKVLKVILETCYLTDDQKRLACELSVQAGADFVKTSTGFGSGGATLADVQLMKDSVKGKAKIKASGGVRDFQTAMEYINLGVQRIGTSNGIAIVTGAQAQEGY